jgi:hypothetical protein
VPPDYFCETEVEAALTSSSVKVCLEKLRSASCSPFHLSAYMTLWVVLEAGGAGRILMATEWESSCLSCELEGMD